MSTNISVSANPQKFKPTKINETTVLQMAVLQFAKLEYNFHKEILVYMANWVKEFLPYYNTCQVKANFIGQSSAIIEGNAWGIHWFFFTCLRYLVICICIRTCFIFFNTSDNTW